MSPYCFRFGVGKRGMEDNVIEETPYLIDELTSSDVEKNLKVPVYGFHGFSFRYWHIYYTMLFCRKKLAMPFLTSSAGLCLDLVSIMTMRILLNYRKYFWICECSSFIILCIDNIWLDLNYRYVAFNRNWGISLLLCWFEKYIHRYKCNLMIPVVIKAGLNPRLL